MQSESGHFDICKERFKTIETLLQNFSEKTNCLTISIKENSIIYDVLRKKIERLEIDIYGNGKTGIKEELNNLINLEKKRDRIISFIMSAFITQIVSLVIFILVKLIKIF